MFWTGFKSTVIAFFLIHLVLCTASVEFTCAEESDWLHNARICGLGLPETMDDTAIKLKLDKIIKEGVNVLEVDTALSLYLNEDEFEKELSFIRKVVKNAHQKNLKIVWYYPSLEVITADGIKKDTSMQRDHPDWIQVNFDRKSSNFFFGSKAFWIEPTDESAWMCPNSSYRDYYFNRIERLAETGLDGIWVDVPLLSTIVGKWPCACPICIKRFEKETGHIFPDTIDFSNASFRRWILWRHKILADFLKDVLDAARKANPKIRLIVEVVSIDHMINTTEGLDVTYLDPEIDIAWELDCISDTTGMTDAGIEDWLNYFIEYKYCRGISGNRGRWAFSYGYRAEDAQLGMASAVAAQCNPYETRIPMMVRSVGTEFRTKMYHWLKSNSDLVFQSQSSAEVALLYSSPTRDFLDGHLYGGMFVSISSPAPEMEWWTYDPEESLLNTNYMIEYRGWGMLLINNFIPFDILATNQLTGENLDRYKTLILPKAASISEKEKNMYLAFVSKGGNLIITGEDSGSMDEYGDQRNPGIWEGLRQKGTQETTHGQGRIFFLKEQPGADYLRKEKKPARQLCRSLMEKCGENSLVQGDPLIYVQKYQHENKTILHVVNYGWVENKEKKAVPVKINFSVPCSEFRAPINISQSSPERGRAKVIPFSREGDHVNFEVETRINSLVIIEH